MILIREPSHISSTEFGITYKLNCSRYLANQSEISHVSGEDGRLYLTEISTPIENDGYCIDYLQTDENAEAEYPGKVSTRDDAGQWRAELIILFIIQDGDNHLFSR